MLAKVLKDLRNDTVCMTLVLAKINRSLTELISAFDTDTCTADDEALTYIKGFGECLKMYEKAQEAFNEHMIKLGEALE